MSNTNIFHLTSWYYKVVNEIGCMPKWLEIARRTSSHRLKRQSKSLNQETAAWRKSCKSSSSYAWSLVRVSLHCRHPIQYQSLVRWTKCPPWTSRMVHFLPRRSEWELVSKHVQQHTPVDVLTSDIHTNLHPRAKMYPTEGGTASTVNSLASTRKFVKPLLLGPLECSTSKKRPRERGWQTNWNAVSHGCFAQFPME